MLYNRRKLFSSTGRCTCGATLSTPDTVSRISTFSTLLSIDVKPCFPTQPKLAPNSDLSQFASSGSAKCQKCSKTLCRGCWESKASNTECCAAQRAIVLFEVSVSPSSFFASDPYASYYQQVLSALDEVYLVDHLKKPSTSATDQKPKKRGKPTGKGSGTGYGSGHRAHNGYNGVNGTLAYGPNGAQTLYQGDGQVSYKRLKFLLRRTDIWYPHVSTGSGQTSSTRRRHPRTNSRQTLPFRSQAHLFPPSSPEFPHCINLRLPPSHNPFSVTRSIDPPRPSRKPTSKRFCDGMAKEMSSLLCDARRLARIGAE